MNRLNELLTRANVTTRKLTELTGIRNSSVCDIKNGKQPMREIHVQKLTSFFDVTSDYLLGYSNKGIGIYFSMSEDGIDHVYISEEEFMRIQQRQEITETIIAHNPSDWTITAGGQEQRIIRLGHSIYRSVDMPKESAGISASIKDRVIAELNSLGTKELEKILKFIDDYIK